MDRSWSLLVLLLLFMKSVNCLIPEDEALEDIIEALSRGDIDFDDVNIALEDLGIDVNETDADTLLLDYSNHISNLEQASHRSKRSLDTNSNIPIPIHFMDLHLGGIENLASTTITEGVVFSNSFNLEVVVDDVAVKETMIYIDNVLHAIRDGALVQMTCEECTLAVPEIGTGSKVTKTVVVKTSANLAFVVQVTARDKVVDTETYSKSIFEACKVNLVDADTIAASSTVEIQVDYKTATPFTIDQSYPRVSLVEMGVDGFLVASFHETQGKVAGPHLTYVKPDEADSTILTETHISSSVLQNLEISEGLVDIELVKVHGKEEYMLVTANDVAVFIYSIEQKADGFFVCLVQKWHITGAVDIVSNSDSIGTFLTILQSNGNMETRIYDTHGFFVKMQDFSYDIDVDSWRSVETSQSMDLPSQDLVVFKDRVKGIKFVRHVMPGMYEELEAPFGITDYIDANPNYETIDLSRSITANDEYEYFWLVKPSGIQVDYIKININPIPFTINQLNDVTICLQDMEYTLLLDKQITVDIDEFTMIPLDEAVATGLVDISYITVSGSATITDLTINMESLYSLSYDEIDYSNSASSLSEGHLLVTHENDHASHIFANTLFNNGPHNSEGRVSIINSPSVQLESAVFTTLSTEKLGDVKVDDIVQNVLTLDGVQTIASKLVLNTVTVSGDTQIGTSAVADTSDIGAALIIPSYFVDLSQTNNLEFDLVLGEVVFDTVSSQTFESTLNSMDVANIITNTELAASILDPDNPILISGVKHFTGDITADLTKVNSIGSKTKQDLLDFIGNVLYTNDSRVLNLNSMQFSDIIVTEAATINQINELDVSNSVLNNLVMDLDTITINADTVFQDNIEIVSLTTSALNGVFSEDYLYEGNDQTINAELNFATLVIPHLKKTDLVNNWDLTTAARIDIDQVLDTKATFTANIIVDNAINCASLVTIGGTDFSEVGRILHEYDDVTIDSSIKLKNNDVPVDQVTINGNSVNFKLAELQDRYLMTDVAQTLPSLTAIHKDVKIDNFVVDGTVDGIDLANVLRVSGEQSADTTNLKFTGTTKFYEDIIINGGDLAAINDVKIKDLKDDIFCDKSDGSDTVESVGVLTITDSDTIVVKSFFDLKVLENLKVFDGATYKSYGTFNTEVASLKRTNTFDQNIVFDEVTVNGVLNSNVDITGTSSATINNKNLAQFVETIVMKSEATDVKTPVVVTSLAGVGQIKSGSTFDNENLYDHYDKYVILDKASEQTITAKISSTNTMTFNNLNVVTQANENTYFNNKNLVDYDSTLMKSTAMVGSKDFHGPLIVGGNVMVNSFSNPNNYLFGIDLKNIDNTGVYISQDQTITAHVIATDITANTVISNEVNGKNLHSFCFKDEFCVLNENADVKFSGAHLSFTTEMIVDGMLNEDTFANRELHLSERSINEITNLESTSKLVFGTNSESTPSLTHLFSDAVRKSSSGQVLTSATFKNTVKVANNFDITSNTVNAGKANEVNFAAIVSDAAFLNQENVFTADNIQVGDITVSGGSLSVSELENTATINEVVLSSHLNTILVKSTDNSLTQTMVGDVTTLSSGLAVTGTASIASKLDGIQVGDYVMTNSVDADKTVTGLTFINTVTVEGSVSCDSEGMFKNDLDNFFDTVVYAIKDGTQELTKNLKFTQDTTFTTLEAVTSVNGITSGDLVLLNSGEAQTIRQAFTQENSTITKNLNTATINGIDLEAVELEILLKDRAETIATTAKVTFTEDVLLPNNEITIQGIGEIIQDFITILEDFSSSMNVWYTKYVAEPLSFIIEEIYVANRVGCKRVKYLDQIEFEPEWFTKEFEDSFSPSKVILGINARQQGQDKYFVKLEKGILGADCPLADGCVCEKSCIFYQAPDGSFQHHFTERAFTFTLDSMSLTATSSYDGTENCPSEDSGDLHVKAVELNQDDLQVHMMGTTAQSLGNVYGSQIIPEIYNVVDMDLVKFGAGHMMPITTGYPNFGLKVYTLIGGAITENLVIASSEPIRSLKTLTFRIEKDGKELEVAHVLVSLDNTGVTVYEWTYNTVDTVVEKDGVLLQKIPTPSFSAMDVFKSQPLPDVQETTHLAVAYKLDVNFREFTIIDILEYNMVDEQYVYSPVVQKHKLRRDNPVTKIQAKQVSDYVSIAVSCDGVIEIYDFIVNVGLQKVSDYNVHGNLVDFTWFTQRLPKTKSKEDLTTLLFIVKEMGGVQSTETLRLGTLGKLNIPELQYKPDTLGY